MAVDKEITIPVQHYVGFCKRGELECPLGFMVPDGEDAAAKKRKTTVDNWASTNSSSYNYVTKTYEKYDICSHSFKNKPMTGFRFTSDIRTSSYGGETKWKIEDPRGFCLEITSGNLGQILNLCTIENGEIISPCVWGRRKATNILLPTCSEEYKVALENTERKNQKTSIKDVKIGDYVIFQNGDEGIYVGAMYQITAEVDHKVYNYYDNKDTTPTRKILTKKTATQHVFIMKGEAVVRPDGGEYTKVTRYSISLMKDAKLSSIRESNTSYEGIDWTDLGAVQRHVNSLYHGRYGYRNYSTNKNSFLSYAKAEFKLTERVVMEPLSGKDNEEDENEVNSHNYFSASYVVRPTSGVEYVLCVKIADWDDSANHQHRSNEVTYTLNKIQNVDLDKGMITYQIDPTFSHRTNYYTSYHTNYRRPSTEIKLTRNDLQKLFNQGHVSVLECEFVNEHQTYKFAI